MIVTKAERLPYFFPFRFQLPVKAAEKFVVHDMRDEKQFFLRNTVLLVIIPVALPDIKAGRAHFEKKR